jgi:hypothetical protein
VKLCQISGANWAWRVSRLPANGPSAIRAALKNVSGSERKNALLAIALKFLDPRKDAIVHRVHDVLLTAEVFFGGLDGGMPQQKLYLLEIPAGLAAQFRARPTLMPHAA